MMFTVPITLNFGEWLSPDQIRPGATAAGVGDVQGPAVGAHPDAARPPADRDVTDDVAELAGRA